MITDLDFLIGLASAHTGLIPSGEFPVDGSRSLEPLLTALWSDKVLCELRERAGTLTAEDGWDLGEVLAALSSLMAERESSGTGAKTLPRLCGAYPGDMGNAPSISSEAPDRYQFAREHARGGMGRVLLVYDKFLARRIALKELLPLHEDISGGSTLDAQGSLSDSATQQRRDRFLHEARITGQLEHPSIVPVYELGRREDGTLYYTMRLVKGRSLHKAIQEADTLEKRLRLLPHFIDLCHAIAFAHSRDVVHRDIKPGNVMIGDFGETVVIDWGLARARGDSEVERINGEDIDTLEGTGSPAIGTPAYMSPEQASGTLNAVDERSDIYSLGAVLYELLSGIAPYPDKTPAKVLAKLLAGAPSPVAESTPEAPEQLMAISSHAMERDPNERYQTAKALSTDIELFLAGRLVGAYNYSLRELLVHFVRRFKAPLVVGFISLLALSGTVFFSYQQIQTERDGAVIARYRAEQEFYFAAISVAHKYIAEGRYDKAMVQLDKCPPRFRHWEWGYLLYLCNRDQRTLHNHEPETVWSTIYMPDGAHMASAGFDNTARIWSANTGALEHTYTSPYGAVIEISPHPTLPLIACAEEGGYITFYDYAQGKVTHTWQIAEKDVNCIQFYPDGKMFITGDDNGYLRLWDFETRTERYAIEPGNRGIEAVVFNAQGDLFASCDRSKSVSVWNTTNGTLRYRLKGHTGRITALAFSPDGTLLASASRDGTVRLWDMRTGDKEHIVSSNESAVWAIAFSPDGQQLASAGSDRVVSLWNTRTWNLSRVFRGHQKQVYCLAFSPDGRMLLSGDEQGTLKQWDTIFPGPQSNQWELAGHQGMINHVAYSPDGIIMVTAAGHWKDIDDTTARVWDANSGTLIKVLEGHTAAVRHVAFHPTESIYTTASHDGTIRVWDQNTHETLRVLGPFDSGVNVVAFSKTTPDTLAAGFLDGQIFLINWRDGTVVKQWQEHEDEILGLAYSPDGRWLVSGSVDETAHVIDAKTGELIKSITEHKSRVPAIAFSADGAWLATGGHDWKINLWDTTTWELAQTLEGHTQGVFSLQFSDDGRRLLSSGSDGITILWDMETYRDVFRIDGWLSAIRPGNRDIITGSRSTKAYLWPAFPWEAATYGENPEQPLSIRVERYKRQFWKSRHPSE